MSIFGSPAVLVVTFIIYSYAADSGFFEDGFYEHAICYVWTFPPLAYKPNWTHRYHSARVTNSLSFRADFEWKQKQKRKKTFPTSLIAIEINITTDSNFWSIVVAIKNLPQLGHKIVHQNDRKQSLNLPNSTFWLAFKHFVKFIFVENSIFNQRGKRFTVRWASLPQKKHGMVIKIQRKDLCIQWKEQQWSKWHDESWLYSDVLLENAIELTLINVMAIFLQWISNIWWLQK